MIYPQNMLHRWASPPCCHAGWRWRCRAGWSTFSDPEFLLVWSNLKVGRPRSAAWSESPSQNEGQCWQTVACWLRGRGSYSWRSPAWRREKREDIKRVFCCCFTCMKSCVDLKCLISQLIDNWFGNYFDNQK